LKKGIVKNSSNNNTSSSRFLLIVGLLVIVLSLRIGDVSQSPINSNHYF
jgi:hypothetical protein